MAKAAVQEEDMARAREEVAPNDTPPPPQQAPPPIQTTFVI